MVPCTGIPTRMKPCVRTPRISIKPKTYTGEIAVNVTVYKNMHLVHNLLRSCCVHVDKYACGWGKRVTLKASRGSRD